MRRKEFESYTEEELQWLMQYESIGQLGIMDTEGYPRIVPVNFVLFNGNIYFHGAQEGEKFTLFQSNPKVTFSVYKPYSYISSYFMSDIACSATIFFKSAHIRGTGVMVDDYVEKRDIVVKIMEKHQPEKKYIEIDLENPKYLSYMKTTGIFKIIPTEITMKHKFGQNLSDKVIGHIIEQLKLRNEPIDQETIQEIIKRREKLKN